MRAVATLALAGALSVVPVGASAQVASPIDLTPAGTRALGFAGLAPVTIMRL